MSIRSAHGIVSIVVFIFLPLWVLSHPVSLHGDAFPKNQYDHFRQRDALQQAEREFENRNWNYSREEKIADQYLAYLKWLEFNNTVDLGFPPSKPIEKVLDRIVNSELYGALTDLPKGGILHSHEDHQLSKRILFDIVWNSEDFDHLYIIRPNASSSGGGSSSSSKRGRRDWTMDFFINPPTDEPWIKVKDSGLTKEQILRQNTLIGLLTEEATDNPTDSSLRWRLINPLWGRASVQLISNAKVKKKYLRAMLEHAYHEGITYLETRRSFGLDLPLYVLDERSVETNGKRFLEPVHESEIELTSMVVEEFAAGHPLFVGHRRISYASRSADVDSFRRVMETAGRLNRKFPDGVIGFDSVGQEDFGHSSLYFLDEYLSTHGDLPLYLHSSETSWPEDLMTSRLEGDLVSTLENSYETLLLRSRRVGHGKGFVKKPYLRNLLRERKIAVEVCIVSNQILGLDVDVRNHYGQILYREGVPVVLGPDDPGTFGYDNTTVDWYAAFAAWGLELGDLKRLALNSLEYSGMTERERRAAVESKWLPSWNDYVAKLSRAACRRDFGKEGGGKNLVSFSRLMPAGGVEGTTVHVFGGGFEAAICKRPRCSFGDSSPVDADYLSRGHLTCVVPACPHCRENSTVPLSISLDGIAFRFTGFYFHYQAVDFQFAPASWSGEGHQTL